ncbi:hypothetical protein HDU96_005844 [Phlyctochytrium bullatum]|nr:hypothetical protein HDU96_005844 [Phlyctochytrium bullatum]
MKLPAFAVAFFVGLTAVVANPLAIVDERPSSIGHDLDISDEGELVDLSLDRAITSTDASDTVSGDVNHGGDDHAVFSRAATSAAASLDKMNFVYTSESVHVELCMKAAKRFAIACMDMRSDERQYKKCIGHAPSGLPHCLETGDFIASYPDIKAIFDANRNSESGFCGDKYGKAVENWCHKVHEEIVWRKEEKLKRCIDTMNKAKAACQLTGNAGRPFKAEFFPLNNTVKRIQSVRMVATIVERGPLTTPAIVTSAE